MGSLLYEQTTINNMFVVFLPKQDISAAATKLNITPRLQGHEETGTTIALALAAMHTASEASALCLGVQVLDAATRDATQIGKAELFAFETKQKFVNIPQPFWGEFKCLSDHAGAAIANSSSASPPPKLMRTKLELITSSASTAAGSDATSAPHPSPAKSATASTSEGSATKSQGMKRRKLA